MKARVAFLFPGQGAETPHMGLDLAETSARARALLVHAGKAAGVDLPPLVARGGPAFARTEVLQPALVAVSLGVVDELERAGIRAHALAGHSLGELTAWAVEAAIPAEDAIDLAARRGALMAREARAQPGGMLTVYQVPVLEEGVVVAGRNAPGEWALAGPTASLRRIAARCRSAPIAAAGPWHSPAMAGALEDFRTVAPAHLAEKLVTPFDFVAELERVRAAGVTHLVTCGPGRVLKGLVRKTLGDALPVLGTDVRAELLRTVEALR